ncbi:MAG: PEP-CTERM sorting domain-containing protein [Vicinamibacterales bacterium]
MTATLRTFAISALALVVVLLTAGSAQAGPEFCGPGPNADGLSLSDVTFRGNNADSCYGVVLEEGDISLATINSLWAGQFGGGNFGFPVESNDGPETVNGITFDFLLEGEEATTFGGWQLLVSPESNGIPYPQTLDIIMVLENKNSDVDQWALYLFDDETFLDGSDAVGTWSVMFLNANRTPKLDEGILYFRNGTPGSGSGSGSGQAAVPEPASLLLLGSGLAAAAARARSRRR